MVLAFLAGLRLAPIVRETWESQMRDMGLDLCDRAGHTRLAVSLGRGRVAATDLRFKIQSAGEKSGSSLLIVQSTLPEVKHLTLFFSAIQIYSNRGVNPS
jgi:hypothetical protein